MDHFDQGWIFYYRLAKIVQSPNYIAFWWPQEAIWFGHWWVRLNKSIKSESFDWENFYVMNKELVTLCIRHKIQMGGWSGV